MLSYIKGSLEVKTSGYIVIETGGLGYKIYMPETSIEKLGDIGSTVKVHTYMKVREDDISLFGFNTNEELRMFELLLSVSGIGAKSAVVILSNISPSKFALAVITNDVGILKKLPGIGPKTAARIILELKDKLKTEETISTSDMDNVSSTSPIIENNNISEAMAALQVLGYSIREIEEALSKFDTSNLQLEDIIKTALKNLSN